MRRVFLTAAVVAWLVTLGTATAQTSTADEASARAAIAQIWANYKATAEAGDLDGWVSLWTSDGVRMPPDAPASVGIDAIRESMVVPLTQFDNKIDINVLETTIAGDWAYSRGTYTLDSTPKGGGATMHVDGKFTTILQRQPDGTWKIHRDIFNSNVPPS